MVRKFFYLCVLLLMAAATTAQDAETGKKQDAGQVSDAAAAQDAETEKKQDGEKTSQKNAGREAETDEYQDAKALSGMSIVGNDEAPKSLYIVPWKSSEIGVETSLNTLLNEDDVSVDRDVFKRQLEFYRLRTAPSLE